MILQALKILGLLTAFGFLQACSLVGGSGQLERARSYKLVPVQGWKEVSRVESDHAYRTESGSTVSVTSSCNRNMGASLEVLTRHLMMGTRSAQIKHQKPMQLGKAQGLFTDAIAKIDGTPLYLNLFVAKSKGCIFDFSLISPQVIGNKDAQDFLTFIAGLEHGNG